MYTVCPLVLVNCMGDWLLVVECDSGAKLGKHAPICVVGSLSGRLVLLAAELLCLRRQISRHVVDEGRVNVVPFANPMKTSRYAGRSPIVTICHRSTSSYVKKTKYETEQGNL